MKQLRESIISNKENELLNIVGIKIGWETSFKMHWLLECLEILTSWNFGTKTTKIS